ncbi:carboxyl transferase [Lentinula lateritia]|uniref:methylcrotonoyl-CoA carboxylase n=1 Tax=Lentinula lateritia TaxID=40482 RepID=A0ABQ8VR62_9AGAR|nr:carboxyl transferase [Lentinula lateritia]
MKTNARAQAKPKCSKRLYHPTVLPSLISTTSPEFISKKEAMDDLIEELDAKTAKARLGGGATAQQRMRSRGKLLPKERLALLLDPHTPFLELSSLAAEDVYSDYIPGAGLITGIGRVSGRECMVIVNDATVKGGSCYPLTDKKQLRTQEIAREHGLPCVYIVESGGAALPHQGNVFPYREQFGRIFYNMVRAYVPALADENVIVQNQGRIFLAGPPLVKAATGEEIDDDGLTDALARDDNEAIIRVRGIIGDLVQAGYRGVLPEEKVEGSVYSAEQLHGIVETDVRQPFDMRDVISRVVDGSRFREFKKDYGSSIVTGFAQIHGYPVGIIGNNGVLFSPSALKAKQFILLCSQRQIPLLFLVKVAGYMLGSKAEKGGIAKDGAKMVRAVACADVPKLTVIVGGSFGAGNYGMAGRANAKIGVMGSGQLLQVMTSHQSSALYSTAKLWDNGIIKPTDTRDVIGLGLAMASRRPSSGNQSKTGRSTTWDGNGMGFGVFRM